MEEKSLIHVIPILWRRRRLIISAVLSAAVLSSIVMLLKPNYYQSSTTFYPVNNALLEPSLQINERSIDYYGDDNDVDRLLSMAQSSELVQKIIDKHNLGDHYKIGMDDKKGKVKLMKRFRKLYRIQKTEYDAIELSIEDQDPEMAQILCSAVVAQMNIKAQTIIQSSRRTILDNLKATHAANSTKLELISDSLSTVRQRYGIYDTKTQAEALTTMEIKSPGDRRVQDKITNYSAGISQVTNLESLQEQLNKELATDALQIQQIEASIATDPSPIHVIEEAAVPIEKSRPSRSLYVLGAMFFIGVLTCGLVLIQDQLKDLTF